VLNNYNRTPSILEEEDNSFSQEDLQPLELDPDLARAIRGDRAREIRRLNKESEARRMQEEEMTQRTARARKPTREDVIEVMDSDEEPVARSAPRNRMSSSPVEVVSSSFRSQVALPQPSAPVPQERDETEEETGEEENDEEEEEEIKRIDIVMKGGPGGTLTANVKVKPTTQMQRLLDHYTQLHKADIPKGKLKSVRVRFDGEWVSLKATIGQLELEDDDQVDVIW
jgi:hypothetical protein